jgi:hypothetical protein
MPCSLLRDLWRAPAALAAVLIILLLFALAPSFALAQTADSTNSLPSGIFDNSGRFKVAPQPVIQVGKDSVTGGPCLVGFAATCVGPSGGAGNASLTPFLVTGNASLSVSSSSARIALPSADTTMVLSNAGTATAYCAPGNASAVATTTNSPIYPGQARVFATGGAADVACVTASGTTTILVETGSGTPAFGVASDLSAAAIVQGPAPSGSTFTGNPLSDGCRSATSLPTAVSDSQAVAKLCDKYGRTIAPSVLSENKVKQTTAITGTGETTVLTADATNKLELYCAIIANTNTNNPVTVSFKDATSTGSGPVIFVPAGETRGFVLPADSGLRQTAANNNWTATGSGTSPAFTVTTCGLKSGS